MAERTILKLSDVNRYTPVTKQVTQTSPVVTPGATSPSKTPNHNPVWEGHVHGPMGSGYDWPRGCIFIHYLNCLPCGAGRFEHYFRYALQSAAFTHNQPSRLVDDDLNAWLRELAEPTFLRVEYRWVKGEGRTKYKHWFDVTPCEEWAAKNAARKQRNTYDNDMAELRQARRVK